MKSWNLIFNIKDDKLKRDVLGLTFNNPVGLAAGFDKDAKLFDGKGEQHVDDKDGARPGGDTAKVLACHDLLFRARRLKLVPHDALTHHKVANGVVVIG